MEFAAKLRRLMREHRYSQDMLAERLEVSQNLVSRWTRGVSTPDLKVALVLARIFGVDLNYLADDGLDLPARPLDEWQRKFWELVGDLGPEEAWRRLIQKPPERADAVLEPRTIRPEPRGEGREKRGAG